MAMTTVELRHWGRKERRALWVIVSLLILNALVGLMTMILVLAL